jgi:hypothetical protein
MPIPSKDKKRNTSVDHFNRSCLVYYLLGLIVSLSFVVAFAVGFASSCGHKADGVDLAYLRICQCAFLSTPKYSPRSRAAVVQTLSLSLLELELELVLSRTNASASD